MTRIKWVHPANSSIETAVVAAPFGTLGIQVMGGILWKIEFLPPGCETTSESSLALGRVVSQIYAYFADPGTPFSLSLAIKGTEFRQKVWRYLSSIGSGSTRTYGHVAHYLKTSARAIGGACRANEFPIIIPCHRVVGAGGLGGFSGGISGEKLRLKRWLLDHETSPGKYTAYR